MESFSTHLKFKAIDPKSKVHYFRQQRKLKRLQSGVSEAVKRWGVIVFDDHGGLEDFVRGSINVVSNAWDKKAKSIDMVVKSDTKQIGARETEPTKKMSSLSCSGENSMGLCPKLFRCSIGKVSELM